jgi:hypothetical protein
LLTAAAMCAAAWRADRARSRAPGSGSDCDTCTRPGQRSNSRNRPSADLQDRPYERAERARKRSSAEAKISAFDAARSPIESELFRRAVASSRLHPWRRKPSRVRRRVDVLCPRRDAGFTCRAAGLAERLAQCIPDWRYRLRTVQMTADTTRARASRFC